MISRFNLHPWLLTCTALTLWPAAARAQAVDYSTLKQVFAEPITTSATGKPRRALEAPKVYLGNEEYVAWNANPVQLSAIRHIEVVKGPPSALCGFNAASGVINIVTFGPLLDNVNTATMRGGTQGYGEGDAVVTQHFGTTAGLRLPPVSRTATAFDQPGNDPSQQPPRGASVSMDGRWQVASKILLRAALGDLDTHTSRSFPGGKRRATNAVINFWRVGGTAATGVAAIDRDAYRGQAINEYFGAAGRTVNNGHTVKLSDLATLVEANTMRVGFDHSNIGSGNEMGFEPELGGRPQGGFRCNISYRHAAITQDVVTAAASDPNSTAGYASETPKSTVIFGSPSPIRKWEFDTAAAITPTVSS
jgi:iron complex outermembrane receptor protein